MTVSSSARARSRGRKRVQVRALKTACARSALREVAKRTDKHRYGRLGGTGRMARFCISCPTQCGADIPVCARPRGQTGMSAPHYHAPSLRLAETASPHLCLRAFAEASPALDDNRRQRTSREIESAKHNQSQITNLDSGFWILDSGFWILDSVRFNQVESHPYATCRGGSGSAHPPRAHSRPEMDGGSRGAGPERPSRRHPAAWR